MFRLSKKKIILITLYERNSSFGIFIKAQSTNLFLFNLLIHQTIFQDSNFTDFSNSFITFENVIVQNVIIYGSEESNFLRMNNCAASQYKKLYFFKFDNLTAIGTFCNYKKIENKNNIFNY